MKDDDALASTDRLADVDTDVKASVSVGNTDGTVDGNCS